MEAIRWIPLKTNGKWAGGFCKILLECLEKAGVEINEVFYEGQTSTVFDHSQTLLTLKIPAHPQMPEFKEVMVSCFENSTLEAHQSCARIALKEVCKQLSLRLKDTPFSVLLTAV